MKTTVLGRLPRLGIPSAGRSQRVRAILTLFAVVQMCFAISTYGQLKKNIIQGTVTDADSHEPLTGVVVRLTDIPGLGARTDSKGAYVIPGVPAGKHNVKARVLGYSDRDKPITVVEDQITTLDFALTVAALKQSEIVVTGLTGEVDRKQLGNAISEVDGAQISNAVTSSAIDALSGRVAGMVVSKPSGTPGAGTYITIRGRKTISGSSEPLYVVDGIVIDNTSITDQHFQSGAIQMSNRAVDLSSDDIENIEVLKGPSASALYGSLAANGVIIITTKKARPGSGEGGKATAVMFSASMDRNENGGRSATEIIQSKYGQLGTGSLSWGALLPADTPKYNHIEELLTPHYSNDQSISFSGGMPEFSYFISGSRNDVNGLIDNSNLLKHNLRANLTLVPFSTVTVKNNTNFLDISNSLPQDGSNVDGLMLGALRTPPEFNNTTVTNPDGTQHRYAGYDNPLWSVANNHFNNDLTRFMNSTEASWTPVDWLLVSGRLGMDKYDQLNLERLAVGSRGSDNAQGFIGQSRYQSSNVNLDFNATGTFKPMEDLSSQLSIGSQTIWANYSSTGATSSTTLPFFDQIAAGATKDATSSRAETKLLGIYAQLNSTYLERYTLTLAVRRDGSSTFGTSDQFHYYPKASFALQLPTEDWGLKSDFISSIKVRGGYGEAGSPSLPGAYATNFLYSTFGNNDGWQRTTNAGRNGMIGIRQAGGDYNALFVAGNSSISPEISIEREIGLDVGFWQNRISLEATFYHTNINNMILNIPVPGSSGFDDQLKNAGSMWNEGVEVSLNASPLRSESFSWSTSLIYSRNYNLVTNLNGVDHVSIYGFTGIENVAIVGRPLGVFLAKGYKRDANGNILYTTGAADDYFGNDFKGAPQITDSLQVIGDPNPSFSLSWRNEFSFFKNIHFSFLFDGVFGQDVWNGTKGALYRFGAAKATEDRNDPWIFDGHPVIDNSTGQPVTREQYYRFYGNSFAYDIEEPVIEKGSYIKLREVSLSYDWDGLKDNLKISNVRFVFTVRNLLTISKYSGFDPEVNNFAQSEARGFDYFNLPPMRTYHLGFTLTY